jgi:hypothetical protein
MPRKTVRADIPIDNPRKYTELIKQAWAKHTLLGASSPFHNHPDVNMSRFQQLMDEALQKREQAEALYEEAEALMQESRRLFGNDKGQTINTPDTLYYMLKSMKQLLLVKHQGVEQALEGWGFNVVISTSQVGRKKKKK